ncbi:MAG: hypothetical protein SWX82_27580 [Cyanobacteriota bacterium]|nr:hypothetical protein [Cyanobacteriota bacterium]
MDCTIFYSWQSDLPNPTNRGFIGDALNKAIKNIRKDDSIKVEPALDRDTQNVGGAPDIVKTIFEKIKQAEVLCVMFRLLIKMRILASLQIQMY